MQSLLEAEKNGKAPKVLQLSGTPYNLVQKYENNVHNKKDNYINMNIQKQFIKYVSQNICGMLGISCYIIVDTFFISQAAGTDGITVLNLVLPASSPVGSWIRRPRAVRPCPTPAGFGARLPWRS